MMFKVKCIKILEPRKSVFLHSLTRSLLQMDWSMKGKYGPLCSMVDSIGVSEILLMTEDLPAVMMNSAKEQSLACYVRR